MCRTGIIIFQSSTRAENTTAARAPLAAKTRRGGHRVAGHDRAVTGSEARRRRDGADQRLGSVPSGDPPADLAAGGTESVALLAGRRGRLLHEHLVDEAVLLGLHRAHEVVALGVGLD